MDNYRECMDQYVSESGHAITRKILVGLVFGVLFVSESIVFEYYIEAYRNWLLQFDVWQFWNYFIIGYLGYHVARWLGLDLIIISSGYLIVFKSARIPPREKFNAYSWKSIIIGLGIFSSLILGYMFCSPSQIDGFFIFILMLLVLIFYYYFNSDILKTDLDHEDLSADLKDSSGSPSNRLSLGNIFHSLFHSYHKLIFAIKNRLKILPLLKIGRLKKYFSVLLIVLIVVFDIFMVLFNLGVISHTFPLGYGFSDNYDKNAPLFIVNRGKIYERTSDLNESNSSSPVAYKELRLMGWDFHYVEFHGPGEAWEPQAQIHYLNKSTIKNDLIAASKAGNFIRLTANWFEIEPERGKYNWSMLDYCFNVLENRSLIPEKDKVYVLLEVGPIKTSKIWVQASLPEWFPYRISLDSPSFRNLVAPFVKAVVDRYKNRSSLFAYQIENEPDLMFHTITDPDEKYIITGDLIGYLNWLNSIIKKEDPDHLTSVNIFANDLNAIPRMPSVDIIYLDYYGTLKDTPPLDTFARRWSLYIKPNVGFGVAELQLNDWQAEHPITNETLEEYYNFCLKSGMTMVLWSELHTESEWEKSALDINGNPTWKYYKVQQFWDDFKNKEIDTIGIQLKFDVFNLGIILLANVIAFLAVLLLYVLLFNIPLKKLFNKFGMHRKLEDETVNNPGNRKRRLITLLVWASLLPGSAWIYVTVANPMLFLFGQGIIYMATLPIIIEYDIREEYKAFLSNTNRSDEEKSSPLADINGAKKKVNLKGCKIRFWSFRMFFLLLFPLAILGAFAALFFY
ncbi:MAG: beta-galactosidase [Promethearchaeota archaeon]